jgi:hypothetical protein
VLTMLIHNEGAGYEGTYRTDWQFTRNTNS